ncbi:MFS transporter [Streptomyces sp. NPDC090798]|uniref:MFS transporter n=1 Tax=Streptomyces sp. NPDC090798 TaxID=3365968 RepID=UPI0037F6017D
MHQSSTETAAKPASRPQIRDRPSLRWWVLAVVAVAQLMVVLDTTIVNIALPSAQSDLGFSNGDRQWVVTAYALAFGSLLLLGGRISDMFGTKIAFLVGLVGFAGASALGGAAGSFESLVIARALQGVFGALLAPAARSILTTTFTDGRDRAKAFGVFGAVAGAGGAIGLLLGGLLTEHLSWRWTMYVNLAFAALAFVGGALLFNRSGRDRAATLDVPGTLLVSAGLFGIVYGLANAESHSWGSAESWGFLVAGAVLLAAFSWWQTEATHPLLPLRVLLDRNRGASYLAVLILGAGMFGVFLFLTYYLQQTLGYTPVRTGLAFLPMVGVMVVTSVLSTTVLVPRFGPKPVVPLGMGLAAGGLVWMTSLGLHSSYAAHIMPALLVSGVGIGLATPPAMSLSTYGVAAQDAGVASAAVNTMQQVGGSIGTAMLNTLATTTAANYIIGRNPRDPQVLAQAALHGYATTYWWSAGLFVIGLVVSVLLYRRGTTGSGPVIAPGAHI